ncbi:unnamed protein product [Anisakis simplex]|uniref:Microtubule-associated protein n=1 Tax=Anisakis simplex TaxID=6269 RepID=A0A0M3KAI8_ANISI|nr:unnamed protein product [Anisakis simplex]
METASAQDGSHLLMHMEPPQKAPSNDNDPLNAIQYSSANNSVSETIKDEIEKIPNGNIVKESNDINNSDKISSNSHPTAPISEPSPIEIEQKVLTDIEKTSIFANESLDHPQELTESSAENAKTEIQTTQSDLPPNDSDSDQMIKEESVAKQPEKSPEKSSADIVTPPKSTSATETAKHPASSNSATKPSPRVPSAPKGRPTSGRTSTATKSTPRTPRETPRTNQVNKVVPSKPKVPTSTSLTKSLPPRVSRIGGTNGADRS